MSKNDEGHQCKCGNKLTRRQFFTTAGAGALAVAASGHFVKEHESSAAVIKSGEGNKISLLINGKIPLFRGMIEEELTNLSKS